MTEETRYQRSKRIEHEKARHERIVGILIRPIEEEWEEACERYEPECRKSDIPSPWTDWDPNPERREFYEGDMPTAEEAKARAEARAKLRRVLWRGLDGRVDRAYNPRLVAE